MREETGNSVEYKNTQPEMYTSLPQQFYTKILGINNET